MSRLERFDADQPPTSAAMAVANVLRERVLSQCTDGELLGSEDELVAAYAVSRPTLRQALRVLQAEGLLTARRGNSGGFFARSPSTHGVARAASLLLRHQDATRAHLLEVVQVLAPAVGRAAARHPDDEARCELLTWTEDLWSRGQPNGTTLIERAVQFAHRLNALCENPALALFATVLTDLVWIGAGRPVASTGAASALREAHLAIARAVADGHADDAGEAMAALAAANTSFS